MSIFETTLTAFYNYSLVGMQFIAGFPQALGMEMGTVRRVACTRTQCLRPGLEPRLLSPETSALTMGPPLLSVTIVLC